MNVLYTCTIHCVLQKVNHVSVSVSSVKQCQSHTIVMNLIAILQTVSTVFQYSELLWLLRQIKSTTSEHRQSMIRTSPKVIVVLAILLIEDYLTIASEGMSKKESFVLRCATSLDDLQWVIKMAAEVGFILRKKEAECYFSAGLTPYFYISELNGKRIGCASLVKHRESEAIGSFYIVAKPYRGSGFGKKMYAFCLSSNEQCNIQTFTHVYLKDHHEKNGFQTGWVLKRYQFTASRAVEGLASCQLPPSVEQILPASQVDFEKLFAYSADMLGSSQTCKLLLAAWLCHLQESSWAAIDKNGEVVGYLIMSETICFPQQANYYIAPLYASSAGVARSLLKVAAEYASANDPRHILCTEIPVEFNLQFVSFLENEIGARSVLDLFFMANKEFPRKCLSKVFGIASTDVL